MQIDSLLTCHCRESVADAARARGLDAWTWVEDFEERRAIIAVERYGYAQSQSRQPCPWADLQARDEIIARMPDQQRPL